MSLRRPRLGKLLISSSAAASSESVADFAIFFILSAFRNLNWCQTAARESSEAFKDCHTNAAILSHNPRGHVLGLIGLGNVGFSIAKKAYLAFGMKVAYYDIVRKTPEHEADISAQYFDTLDGLLAVSDCVVLATPASPDGRKLITKDVLSRFKRGSRFINIARGSLVDEEALADAIDEGRLIAVGLDVHENEPNVSERLKVMRQVTMTSHNAGGTLDTYVLYMILLKFADCDSHIGFERLSLENIDAVLKGRDPLTPVNLHLMRTKASNAVTVNRSSPN